MNTIDEPISRIEAEQALRVEDNTVAFQAMLRLAFYEDDVRWILGFFEGAAGSSSPGVRNGIGVAIAHLASSGEDDFDAIQALRIVQRLAFDANPAVVNGVEAAMSDLRAFYPDVVSAVVS